MRYFLAILLTPFIFAEEWSATNYNEFKVSIDHVQFDDSKESANTFSLQGKFDLLVCSMWLRGFRTPISTPIATR